MSPFVELCSTFGQTGSVPTHALYIATQTPKHKDTQPNPLLEALLKEKHNFIKRAGNSD